MARQSTLACSLHRQHRPPSTYTELHHVVPQAWQVAWKPPQPWPNGGPSPDRPGVVLWDARTVAVCRTGHGNVHFWLVKVMKAYARLADLGAAVHEVRAEARVKGLEPSPADLETALQAPHRFVDAGGSLSALVAASLWGEI